MNSELTFTKWLQSLPYLEYGKKLKEIERKTFVSRITVYNWRAGNHNVPKYAQHIIKEIAGLELVFPKTKKSKSNRKSIVSSYIQDN